MELEFKPDFEEAAERWAAYWRGERFERPLVGIMTLKPGAEPVARPSWMACLRDDVGPVIDQLLGWAATREFLGEAIPFYHVFFGPDHLAALLGAELKVHPDSPQTSWPEHFVEDWDDASIEVRWDGRWWRRTVECIRAFRRRCDGKVLISIPTLQGGLDCLAALRGAEKLLMDMIETPEKVHAALDAVNAAYDEVTRALSEELDVPRFGSINRHAMYCRGTSNIPQCDISCMMSPEMFREFGWQAVAHEARTLDAAEYHLDGPDAIKHLEAICEIAEIKAIQWQPGAGEAATTDWTGLYKRIDSLGKGHVIYAGPQRIRALCRELHSPQLYFGTDMGSRKDAEAFLAELGKIWR